LELTLFFNIEHDQVKAACKPSAIRAFDQPPYSFPYDWGVSYSERPSTDPTSILPANQYCLRNLIINLEHALLTRVLVILSLNLLVHNLQICKLLGLL
jgi:hypothetical protein